MIAIKLVSLLFSRGRAHLREDRGVRRLGDVCVKAPALVCASSPIPSKLERGTARYASRRRLATELIGLANANDNPCTPQGRYEFCTDAAAHPAESANGDFVCAYSIRIPCLRAELLQNHIQLSRAIQAGVTSA